MTFAPDQLRVHLDAKQWSIERLAVTANLAPASVRAYVDGRTRPSPAALVALANALGATTADLAPLTDAPTLHELRWHTGMTVAELAKVAGAPRAGLYGILRGANPLPRDESIRQRLAAALAVDDVGLHRAWLAARERITADS